MTPFLSGWHLIGWLKVMSTTTRGWKHLWFRAAAWHSCQNWIWGLFKWIYIYKKNNISNAGLQVPFKNANQTSVLQPHEEEKGIFRCDMNKLHTCTWLFLLGHQEGLKDFIRQNSCRHLVSSHYSAVGVEVLKTFSCPCCARLSLLFMLTCCHSFWFVPVFATWCKITYNKCVFKLSCPFI